SVKSEGAHRPAPHPPLLGRHQRRKPGIGRHRQNQTPDCPALDTPESESQTTPGKTYWNALGRTQNWCSDSSFGERSSLSSVTARAAGKCCRADRPHRNTADLATE